MSQPNFKSTAIPIQRRLKLLDQPFFNKPSPMLVVNIEDRKNLELRRRGRTRPQVLCKNTTITVPWVSNIRLMFPSAFLKVTSLPNIKPPASSTFQYVDHIHGVTVKVPTILPRKFVMFTESKTLAHSDVPPVVVFTTTATVKQSWLLCSTLFFCKRELRAD